MKVNGFSSIDLFFIFPWMYLKVKRFLDFIFALTALTFLLPVLVFSSLYLSFRLLESPFFIQERIGYRNRTFTIWKLRTFPSNFEENRDMRLPMDLQFIRDWGVDEIPQLLQIVSGHMSFVGPRPLLKEYLPLYNQDQLTRHNCLPGIIGLAQVKGGNNLSWQKRLRYDTFYVKHLGIQLDLFIILSFFTRGKRPDGNHFSTKFSGNSPK